MVFFSYNTKEHNIFLKRGKLDFIKINNFYATNYTIKKVKSPQNGGKYL